MSRRLQHRGDAAPADCWRVLTAEGLDENSLFLRRDGVEVIPPGGDLLGRPFDLAELAEGRVGPVLRDAGLKGGQWVSTRGEAGSTTLWRALG